jgi:carboxyl-terminal processing protease
MSKPLMRLCFTVAIGIALVGIQPYAHAVDRSDTYRQLNLFSDVFARIRSNYVEEVEDKEMIEAAINGMLTSLDPHSSFLNAERFEDMQVQTKGEFGGLGIEVTMENGLVKVISPIDDTPAFRAGIEAGDFITSLDGEPIMGMTLSEAVDQMRGKPGTTLTVTVARKGERSSFDVDIIRDIIKIRSVRHRQEGDTAYIRITSFNEQTEPGLEKAISELTEEIGEDLNGLILDLRNNPGGLLDQAVAVSDAFLDHGEIVQTRGRDPQDVQRYHAQKGDLIDGLPIIVLINGGSASASEIVAGALQDYNRALIVGTKSFGKGSVQTIIPLGREKGAMRLTTARYFTPSGRSIQAEGIEPDLIVEPAKIEKFERNGKRRTEASLRGHLDNPNGSEEGEEELPLPTDAKKASDKKDDDKKDSKENESDSEAGDDDDESADEDGEEGDDADETDEKKSSTDRAIEDYQLAYALDLIRGISIIQNRRSEP